MARVYHKKVPGKIGIIGAGFSGTALAAALCRRSKPGAMEIVLFDKSGSFGLGPAYSTPYLHHLLNVRVEDMSPFADDLEHFTRWLDKQSDLIAHIDNKLPLAKQFVPRYFYGQYLQHLLDQIRDKVSLNHFVCEPAEVVNATHQGDQVLLTMCDGRNMLVDKAVLALGNNQPHACPFPVGQGVRLIDNPWDYTAVTNIGKHDSVLIIGTGLSMIDAVLSLHHQQHQGEIFAVSRRGLLPLSHADARPADLLSAGDIPMALSSLTKKLRLMSRECVNVEGDWRTVVNAFRNHAPTWWQSASLSDKNRFLRHVLPYWNIHRHRVHVEIMALLENMMLAGQLKVWAGRILGLEGNTANIKLRYSNEVKSIAINALINCMGPTQAMQHTRFPLVKSLLDQGLASLDSLRLGFKTSMAGALCDTAGNISSQFYTLGPPTKGMFWECSAVPEIRKQIDSLVSHLLA